MASQAKIAPPLTWWLVPIFLTVIVTFINLILSFAFSRSVIGHSIVHRVLLEYLTYADTSSQLVCTVHVRGVDIKWVSVKQDLTVFIWVQKLVTVKPALYGHQLYPLSPNSDQDQISPNNIHTLSRDKLWELIKWSPKRKCLDLFSNSLNSFFKEMCRDQFGEFVCGYLGLKGLIHFVFVDSFPCL